MVNIFKGRFVVLFLFCGIFVSIAFGQMGLLNTMETSFPGQKGMIVKKTEGSSDTFFETLKKIAKEDKIRFYRSVIEKGRNKGFVFGKLPEKSNQELTQEESILKDTPAVGAYSIDGGELSKKSLEKLKALKVTYEIGETGWRSIVSELLFRPGIRSQTFYITLLLFGVTLYALKISKARKSMISRMIGKQVNTIFSDLLILVFGFAFWGMLGALLAGYLGTSLFSIFLYLLGAILPILLIVSLSVNLLFNLFIYLTPIVAILKNKRGSAIFHYIWLIVIAISIGMMTVSIGSSMDEYQLAKTREDILSKWDKLSDFNQLAIKAPDYLENQRKPKQKQLTMEEIKKQSERMAADAEKWRLFYDNIPEEDKIFVKKPDKGIPTQKTVSASDFNQPEKMIEIDTQWTEKVWRVSPSLIKLSQEVTKENPDIFTNNKAVTLYIPQKYADAKDKILPVETSNFVESGLKISDFEVKVIPDGFKLFVPLLSEIKDSQSPVTFETDAIIAQYNSSKIPNNPRVNFGLSNLAQFALYRQSALTKSVESSKVKEDILDYQTPFAILKIYQKETESQIQRSIFAIVTLFIAQIFVLYQFVKLRLEVKMRKIAIGQVLGNNQFLEYLKVFVFVLVSIVLGLAYAFNERVTSHLIALSGLAYVLLAILIITFAAYRLLRKRVNILKGEGEIL